ncbi:hotdog family protein [Natrarchaeobaculum sulfurireducens]
MTAACEVSEKLGDPRYRIDTIVEDGEGTVVLDGDAVVLVDALPVEADD